MTCDVCSHPDHTHQVATERSPLRPCVVCPCTDFAPFAQYFGAAPPCP